MKKSYFAALAFVLATTFFSFIHTFHFSETLIEWDPQSQNLEMTIKVFADDWNLALGDTLHLREYSLYELHEVYAKYINQHMQFESGGELIQWNYLGFEADGDVYYHYLGSTEIQEPKEIRCQFLVMMDLYEDQKNLLNFRKNGKTTSLYFLEKSQPQILNWP